MVAAVENGIMDEGFQFLDIILFAMVAAFIVLRLRSVLGRRTGHERPPPEAIAQPQEGPEDNVIQLPDRGPDDVDDDVESDAEADSAMAAGLAQIKIADHGFDGGGFLSGARAAYEMIVAAFAEGDDKTLRPMLNDEVYDNFNGVIDQRREREQTFESTLVSIKSADIVEARMKGPNAEVTVKFVSEIVNVLRDASGEVVEGDPTAVREVTDIWTFSRHTRASDPNWTLIETRSSN